MDFRELTSEERMKIYIAVANDLHLGMKQIDIAKKFGVTWLQIHRIKGKMMREEIPVDWSDVSLTSSPRYYEVDEAVMVKHKKLYCTEEVDWSKVNVGNCLGVRRYGDD